MKFENTEVFNIPGAIYSMRMPFMSHEKSDSQFFGDQYVIGDRDLDLAKRLIIGGDPHAKFLRSIYVNTVITAPVYICAELDTYKIGTVRNSSSVMHTGAKRDYNIDDFTFDGVSQEEIEDFKCILDKVNKYRKKYLETNDYRYFRIMRQMLGCGYDYTFSFSTNYAQLRNMWYWRVKQPHRLKEWTEDFGGWIKELPYSNELIMFEGDVKQ